MLQAADTIACKGLSDLQTKKRKFIKKILGAVVHTLTDTNEMLRVIGRPTGKERNTGERENSESEPCVIVVHTWLKQKKD